MKKFNTISNCLVIKLSIYVIVGLFAFLGYFGLVYAGDITPLDLNGNGIPDSTEPEIVVSTNTSLPAGEYSFNNLIIASGVTLTLEGDPDSSNDFKGVKINATNITVSYNAHISADGEGYVKGPGFTSSDFGSSYGGVGGGNTSGSTYGSNTYPIDLGSGNGIYRGGGAMQLVVSDTLEIKTESSMPGTISADGYCIGATNTSGGSIYITARKIIDNGFIHANGITNDYYNRNGGGGGRVYIKYQDLSSRVGAKASPGYFCYSGVCNPAGEYGTVVISHPEPVCTENCTSQEVYSQLDSSTPVSPYMIDNTPLNPGAIFAFPAIIGTSGNITDIKFAYNNGGNSLGHFIGVRIEDLSNPGTYYFASKNADGFTCGDAYESDGESGKIFVDLDSSVHYLANSCNGPELTLDPTHTYGVAIYRNRGGDTRNFFYGKSSANDDAYLYVGTKEGEVITKKNPVLIIPGVLGTEILNDEGKLWINLGKNIIDFMDEFMDPLQFNNNLTPSDTSLFIDELIGSVFSNHFYDLIIDDLSSKGYSKGTNQTDTLFTFPYDWRYGVTGILGTINGKTITQTDLLKEKIDEIRQQTGSDKVDIIAHSTGGLLLKKYVIDNQSDNHIGKAIFVGVPNTGAPQAINTLVNGSNFGNPFLNSLEMKKLAQNMPIIYDLTPSREYYNKKGSYVKVVDKNLMLNVTSSKDLNFDEVDNFLTADHKLNALAVTNSNNLHTSNFDNFDLRTAGVDLYAIDGCKTGTLGKIIENRIHNINPEEYFMSYSAPEIIPGDGTVPLESATNLPVNEENKYYALQADHSKMLSQNGIRQKIVDILSGGNSSFDSGLITQDISECKLNGKAISIYSPVDIDITDNQGNHSGLLNGSIQNDIPNADFEIMGDHKFVYLPDDEGQTYTIDLKGTGSGTFTLKNENISNNNVTETEVFANLPVTTSLSGQVNMGSVTTLDINNGDGNISTITPSSTVNANQSEDNISPITKTNISGTMGQTDFYRSDVSVTLSAIDPVIAGIENQTSGVLQTNYNLDNTGSKIYNLPIVVKTEGLHTLSFFSVDKAGNNEQEKTITFTIDKKSPEPRISVDLTTKDLKIESAEVNATISKSSNTYILTDKAGNVTKIIFQKTFNGKLLTYAKLTSVQYNNDKTINLPSSSFVYLWDMSKSNQTLLSQTIAVDNAYTIEAVYDAKKNQTTTLLKKKGVALQKQVFSGLHVSVLTLSNGVVGYEL